MIRAEVVRSLGGLIVVVGESLGFGRRELGDFSSLPGLGCGYAVIGEVGWGGLGCGVVLVKDVGIWECIWGLIVV